jgi:hypothetical protein
MRFILKPEDTTTRNGKSHKKSAMTFSFHPAGTALEQTKPLLVAMLSKMLAE